MGGNSAATVLHDSDSERPLLDMTQLIRLRHENSPAMESRTSSVHELHPHMGGSSCGVLGADVGSLVVGDSVGLEVGRGVGETVGDIVRELVGEVVGDGVGFLVVGDSVGFGEIVLGSLQHGQISGNSSLTNRQAPSSSNGPSSMPRRNSVSIS